MKRVIAVIVIAALTTLMVGIDRTSWADQKSDQEKAEKQRKAVDKSLGGMGRGTTATLQRKDGTKIDVVIEAINPDTVTVWRQNQDRSVGTETIPIADIAKIEKMDPGKAARSHKALIGTAIALGVIVGLVAVCASSYSDQQQISKS